MALQSRERSKEASRLNEVEHHQLATRMIRYCLSTATQVEAVRKANGKWSVEGIVAEGYAEQIELTEKLLDPLNVTFHFAEVNECLHRLKNNLSDASSVFMQIDSMSPDFNVPQPLFAGRLQYITGYNFTDDQEDTATVFTNADLLKPEVYCWTSFLLALFIVVIVVNVAMFYHLTKKVVRISPMQMVKKQLSRMFYYKSTRFRWVTLLYSLLCFIMMTSFLCLYKTSHIIIEQPFYPKNYQESLEHESSLAFYFDQFAVVSSAFKNAPPDSIRGKLWAKLIATGRQNDFKMTTLDPASLPGIFKKASRAMIVERGIFLVPPLFVSMIRLAGCMISPENELWVVKIITDPIEPEIISGHAWRKTWSAPWRISQKMSALFETQSLVRGYSKHLDQSDMAANVVGTSKSHQWKQKVLCEDETAFMPDPIVKAIPLFYFASFFKAIAVVWLFAFILNIFQILHALD